MQTNFSFAANVMSVFADKFPAWNLFENHLVSKFTESKHEASVGEKSPVATDKAHSFTYRDLATATRDFREEFFIGQGGFGAVYRGHLKKNGQVTIFQAWKRPFPPARRVYLTSFALSRDKPGLYRSRM